MADLEDQTPKSECRAPPVPAQSYQEMAAIGGTAVESEAASLPDTTELSAADPQSVTQVEGVSGQDGDHKTASPDETTTEGGGQAAIGGSAVESEAASLPDTTELPAADPQSVTQVEDVGGQDGDHKTASPDETTTEGGGQAAIAAVELEAAEVSPKTSDIPSPPREPSDEALPSTEKKSVTKQKKKRSSSQKETAGAVRNLMLTTKSTPVHGAACTKAMRDHAATHTPDRQTRNVAADIESCRQGSADDELSDVSCFHHDPAKMSRRNAMGKDLVVTMTSLDVIQREESVLTNESNYYFGCVKEMKVDDQALFNFQGVWFAGNITAIVNHPSGTRFYSDFDDDSYRKRDGYPRDKVLPRMLPVPPIDEISRASNYYLAMRAGASAEHGDIVTLLDGMRVKVSRNDAFCRKLQVTEIDTRRRFRVGYMKVVSVAKQCYSRFMVRMNKLILRHGKIPDGFGEQFEDEDSVPAPIITVASLTSEEQESLACNVETNSDQLSPAKVKKSPGPRRRSVKKEQSDGNELSVFPLDEEGCADGGSKPTISSIGTPKAKRRRTAKHSPPLSSYKVNAVQSSGRKRSADVSDSNEKAKRVRSAKKTLAASRFFQHSEQRVIVPRDGSWTDPKAVQQTHKHHPPMLSAPTTPTAADKFDVEAVMTAMKVMNEGLLKDARAKWEEEMGTFVRTAIKENLEKTPILRIADDTQLVVTTPSKESQTCDSGINGDDDVLLIDDNQAAALERYPHLSSTDLLDREQSPPSDSDGEGGGYASFSYMTPMPPPFEYAEHDDGNGLDETAETAPLSKGPTSNFDLVKQLQQSVAQPAPSTPEQDQEKKSADDFAAYLTSMAPVLQAKEGTAAAKAPSTAFAKPSRQSNFQPPHFYTHSTATLSKSLDPSTTADVPACSTNSDQPSAPKQSPKKSPKKRRSHLSYRKSHKSPLKKKPPPSLPAQPLAPTPLKKKPPPLFPAQPLAPTPLKKKPPPLLPALPLAPTQAPTSPLKKLSPLEKQFYATPDGSAPECLELADVMTRGRNGYAIDPDLVRILAQSKHRKALQIKTERKDVYYLRLCNLDVLVLPRSRYDTKPADIEAQKRARMALESATLEPPQNRFAAYFNEYLSSAFPIVPYEKILFASKASTTVEKRLQKIFTKDDIAHYYYQPFKRAIELAIDKTTCSGDTAKDVNKWVVDCMAKVSNKRNYRSSTLKEVKQPKDLPTLADIQFNSN